MASNYAEIATAHTKAYGTDLVDWAGELLANRYAERTHFLFELLQNAEDALKKRGETTLPRSVSFELKNEGLEVRHFGVLFSPRDVRSICAIGKTTKTEELTAIGRFGIGFKSVYAFTDRPEIHSGDEHFAIEKFVLPVGVPAKPCEPEETRFWLPFKNGDTKAAAEVAKALREMTCRPLLFLRQIEEIRWLLPDGSTGSFLKQTERGSGPCSEVTLVGEVAGSAEMKEERWLLFSRPVGKSAREQAGLVEVGFLLGPGADEETEVVTPVDDPKLVVFFPTNVSTGTGFLLQGPFRTTPSRDNVPHEDEWNRRLVKETASLLIEALTHLRERGKLSVEALQVLPLDETRFRPDSMFRPLFDAVRDALKTQPFLPMHGGGHVEGQRARLARTEGLRELLTPSQLAALVGSQQDLFWLSEDISKDRTAALREYLVQKLGIVEVTPDYLQPRLSEPFLAKQPDEWMARFYLFLVGQRAMLQKLLKQELPFIRCSDGTHVPPKRGEQPQAFLPSAAKTGFRTVKESLCRTSDILKFLKDLGIAEPDPVDDVIQNVLDRYTSPHLGPTTDVYAADLSRILAAYRTDSSKARAKLVEALKASYFVRTLNAKTGERRFSKPTEAYRATERMKTVWDGVPGVQLVDDSHANLRGEAVRDLLEACGCLDILRTTSCDQRPTAEESRDLRRKEGHDVCTMDWVKDNADCVELHALLQGMGSLPCELATAKCLSLWNLLRETLQNRREGYFQATYAWAYGQRTWTSTFSTQWVRRLQNEPWIMTVEGLLKRPLDVSFADVHPSLRKEAPPFLIEILGFRPEAIQQLAEQAKVELETLRLIQKYSLSAEQLRKLLGEAPSPIPGASDSVLPPMAPPDPAKALGEILGGVSPVPPGAPIPPSPLSNASPGRASSQTPVHPSGSPPPSVPGSAAPRDTFYTYVATSAKEKPHDDEGVSPLERTVIESAAISFIIEKEPILRRTPNNHPGFDLYEGPSLSAGTRFVEVKSLKGPWKGSGASLSHTQFRMAQEKQSRYWLYVVEFATTPEKRRLHRIQDPAGKTQHFTFDPGWQALGTGPAG